jgi:alkylmercury lyase
MAQTWYRDNVSLDQILEAVIQAFPTLDHQEQRVGILLYRLLAGGDPVEPSALTQVKEWSGMPADQFLRQSRLSSLVEWDHGETVIGFGGLTTRHSRHSLLLGERRLSAWCAWDAMFIPELLGATAMIESVCPQTGNPVRLRVGPDGIERMDDRTPVLSFTTPSPAGQVTSPDQTILSFCSYVNLFESRQAGTTWISTRPGTFLLSVADGFTLARRYNAARYGAVLHGEPSPPHGMPRSDVA